MMLAIPSGIFGFWHDKTQFSELYAVPVLDGKALGSLVLDGMGRPGHDVVSLAQIMESLLSTRGLSGGGGV